MHLLYARGLRENNPKNYVQSCLSQILQHPILNLNGRNFVYGSKLKIKKALYHIISHYHHLGAVKTDETVLLSVCPGVASQMICTQPTTCCVIR